MGGKRVRSDFDETTSLWICCNDWLLRYDILELWETGWGAEMNWSVSLHRVKTLPQLMCCALV